MGRKRTQTDPATSGSAQPVNWLCDLELSRYVAIDLETTGLDSEKCSIIEIGAVRFQDGLPVDEYQTFIRTDQPLDRFITELTGITDADLDGAPDFPQVAERLLEFIGRDPLVGQNIEFDLGFLRAAGETIRSVHTSNPFAFPRRNMLDTAMLSRIFWPEQTSFSLSSLSKLFEVPVSRAHRAVDDARTTGIVLARLVEQLPCRVWGNLAVSLDRLIGSTTHRSRFFFKQLVPLSKGVPKPPTAAPEPIADKNSDLLSRSLSELIGVSGHFEQVLPFFEYRKPQLELAEAVERAFDRGSILLTEAPTGVGKSLAYLIPAVRWSCADSDELRQVIVSSHTKVLQEQLYRKDIQDLRLAIGNGFCTAVLKGRNNYLCLRRLHRLLTEADERLSDQDRINLMPLVRWSELTVTGDVSEISGFNPKYNPALWAQVSSDSSACAGSQCSAAKGDFYRKAQERAVKAQIIFVNHALLASDWSRFASLGNRRVILDEAHQLERAIVGALTVELSAPLLRAALSRLIDERSPRGLLENLKAHCLDSGAYLTDKVDRLEDQTRTLHALNRQTFGTLADRMVNRIGDSERTGKLRYQSGDRLHGDIANAIESLNNEWQRWTIALSELLTDASDLRGDQKLPPELLFEFRSAVENAEGMRERFSRILIQEGTSDSAAWIEFGRGGQTSWCSLYAAPVSISPMMAQAFWPTVETAVLTSATMSVGGSFKVIRDTLGLADGPNVDRVEEKIVGSPFRLSEQSRTLVPVYFPDPRSSNGGHTTAVCDLSTKIVERFQRGTLILCTSNELVDRVTIALQLVARKAGRMLLSQGSSGSLPELLNRFRQSRDAILVGAASFWEGIDVVGDALQILIVTRIPFDVPTDPWISARSEAILQAGGDPFMDYSLPVATLRLKQGIGRLIRHPQDRGITILADPRLFRTRYGAIVRNSLSVAPEPMTDEDNLFSQIQRFFESE